MDREKQPFEELEARKSYELILITHNGSASKFRIITEWTDSSGKQHTKNTNGRFFVNLLIFVLLRATNYI